jgi:adenosylhomocysteine nucleosidase
MPYAAQWSGFAATDMSSLVKIRIAIIAAMEREVKPLIRSWKMRMMEHDGRRYRLFESGEAVLICGGIGAAAARRATEAVIREVNPQLVISVGFAGALDDSIPVGHVLEPRAVINSADGVRTEIGSGQGILVSSATVADKEQKSRFRKAYGASAVDMEAAAVAQGAQARGVEFGALKAISDAADFNLPVLDRFVSDNGNFHSARFAFHVALRPWLWATTISLARNSSKASYALCDAIESYLDRQTLDCPTLDCPTLDCPTLDCQNLDRQTVGRETRSHHASPNESSEAELNQNKVSDESGGVHTRTGTQSHNQVEGEQ